MVLLDLNELDKWSEGSPIAQIEASHAIQAAVFGRAAAAFTDTQLEDPATFRYIVGEALRTQSATDVAFLVGATKSTVLRWSTGDAVPRYPIARTILARKILKRLLECGELVFQEISDHVPLRVEHDKVVADPPERELASA